MIFRSPTLMSAVGMSPDGLPPRSPRGSLAHLCAGVFVMAAMWMAQPPSASAGPLFAAPFLSFAIGENNRATAVGDFNGDGNLDLAITGYDYDGVYVLLGHGDGTFGPKTQAGGAGRYPYYSYTIAIGDLNGDGRQDLVTATGTISGTDTINVASVYLGNGDGTFGAPRDFVTGMQPFVVAIGDVNGDGKQDLVTANSQGTVSVLLGNGDGSFAPKGDYAAGTFPQSLSMADLNGDGNLDIAVANTTSNTVSVLLGTGDGSFIPPTAYAVGSFPVFVLPVDLNGDGKLDLAIANNQSGTISMLLGNGDGTFGARTDLDTGTNSYPSSAALADVDGDHVKDLIVVTGGLFSVTTFLGQGNGIFSKSHDRTVGYYAGNAVLGDFNRDGKLDVALATEFSATVAIGNGDGTFGVDDEAATGVKPSSVAIGDFNGDSQPDLAVANQSDNTVSIFLGNGSGKFATRGDYITGSGPNSIVIGDFDQDGHADLAVTNYNSSSISVLMGNGDGTLGPKSDYATGQAPLGLAVGDLNGDGKADLVTTSPNTSSVSVFMGRGDGTFSPRNDFPVEDPFFDSPIAVALGDFNLDGKLDLAVTTGFWNIDIFLGNGDGTFGAASATYPTAGTPTSLAIADLNGDGKPDVAETHIVPWNSTNPGSISVRLGTGDGTLAAPVTFETGIKPGFVAIADLNGDGKPDLAVANQGSFSTSVLLGKGEGTFPDRTDYGTQLGSSCIAIGDLNRDGRPDMAVTNSSTNTVSVLMNINDLPVPALATLVSADAEPGRISLRWYLGDHATTAKVYRRLGSAEWQLRSEATSDGQGNLRYEDTNVEPATKYGYRLGIQTGNGEVLSGEVSVTVPALSVLSLEGAQPNPANKDLFVSLSLPDDSPGHLEVFDVAGRRVLDRQLGGLGPGRHLVAFRSSELRPGVYMVRLHHGGQSLSARAVVVH